MTIDLLKYAFNRKLTERERTVLKEEVNKLIGDWTDSKNTFPNSDDNIVADERIAILSKLKDALAYVDGDDISMKTFGITTEISTNYLPSEDITIIWKHRYVCDECIDRTIVGFYYGEPDAKSTETFSLQTLTAEFLY